MKAIRRSLKGDKEPKQPHISVPPKSAIAIVPPKRVIKALFDYTPEQNDGQYLAFHKGDFFHVVSREDDEAWYEACNPLIPAARGLVPVSCFEVIGKQQRQSGNSVTSNSEQEHSHDSGFSERGTFANDPVAANNFPSHRKTMSIGRTNGAMVYGIVQYDFNAERPDELEAKAGEAIIVVAQSTSDWFVAKPIGRLGGPGLIPVSFIDIKDTQTMESVADPLEAVRKAGVPKVEEWKRMAAEYKNSSITLGKFDQQMSSDMSKLSMQNNSPHPYSQSSSPHANGNTRQPHREEALPLAPISASVPRYCFDNDMYWYIIECQMEDGRWFELSRYYADFYDFQIALLEAFPEEAGNKGKTRTLPFMPGPVAHVTDAISNGRRQNLDEYIKKIVSMPPHISKSSLVRNLFKPKPGQDFEIDPNALGEDYRLSGGSQLSAQQAYASNATPAAYGQADSGYGYGQQPSHQRGRGSISSQSNNNWNGSYAPPALQTQASTITQNSQSSSVKPTSGAALKLKVHFQDEIHAIRVPHQELTYRSLYEKLMDRFKLNEQFEILYKDEVNGQLVEMQTDSDLDMALSSNPKLAIHLRYLN